MNSKMLSILLPKVLWTFCRVCPRDSFARASNQGDFFGNVPNFDSNKNVILFNSKYDDKFSKTFDP